jgi:hypothetical protein
VIDPDHLFGLYEEDIRDCARESVRGRRKKTIPPAVREDDLVLREEDVSAADFLYEDEAYLDALPDNGRSREAARTLRIATQAALRPAAVREAAASYERSAQVAEALGVKLSAPAARLADAEPTAADFQSVPRARRRRSGAELRAALGLPAA